MNPGIFFIFFIPFFIGITALISFISGWGELAKYYRYHGQQIDKKRYMQSAVMRGVTGYRGCLTVGANTEGLYLSVFFLFRPAHPPLFIPWNEIKIRRTKFFVFKLLEMRFTRATSVTLAVYESLEGFLQSASVRPLPFATEQEAAGMSSNLNWYWWVSVIAGVIGLIAALCAILFIPHKT